MQHVKTSPLDYEGLGNSVKRPKHRNQFVEAETSGICWIQALDNQPWFSISSDILGRVLWKEQDLGNKVSPLDHYE